MHLILVLVSLSVSNKRHVNPQIKLVAVEQQGFVNVSLNKSFFLSLNSPLKVFQLPEQKYPITFSARLRLSDIANVRVLLHVLNQPLLLSRVIEGRGHEVVSLRVHIHANFHLFSEHVFMGQLFSPRISIDYFAFLFQNADDVIIMFF